MVEGKELVERRVNPYDGGKAGAQGRNGAEDVMAQEADAITAISTGEMVGD